MKEIEEIALEYYETMTGLVYPEPGMEWVENIFVEGTAFSDAYEDLAISREHLYERFGIDVDDDDLERIMSAVLAIEREIAKNMFYYGMEHAKRNA